METEKSGSLRSGRLLLLKKESWVPAGRERGRISFSLEDVLRLRLVQKWRLLMR